MYTQEKKMVCCNKLKVTVMNGRSLKCKDPRKKVTPYCLLQLGKISHETRYICNDCNPEWNETFDFDVVPGCEVLSFSIWHKNSSQNDVVIGYAFVDFGNLKKDEKTSINIQLMGIYSGEINLVVHPMYETTASKVDRLEHKIVLLTYDLSRCTGKMEQLNKKITTLTNENKHLHKTNKQLEKEKRILLEYEILSTSNTPCRPRRTRNVFEFDTRENHANGSLDTKSSTSRYFDDEFDIISERDIDLALSTSNEHSYEKVENDHKTDMPCQEDITKISLNDWEHHFRQSVEVFDEELNRLNNNEILNMKYKSADDQNNTRLLNGNNDLLISRVTELESENHDLKLLLQQMKHKNDEELSQLIEEIRVEETIMNQISKICNDKIENEAKMETLKEVISDFDIDAGEECEEFVYLIDKRTSNVTSTSKDLADDNSDKTGDMKQATDAKSYDGNENEVIEKIVDEPDVIREYYWDEYLPISTKHSKDDEEDSVMNFDDLTDDITDDIDNFIRSNYIFRDENTLMLRSDPELYTKSDIEEENEHFKDMNIRLIKENEELDGCLQLLHVQIKNLKKIQSILFDQLVKRAPAYMNQMIDKITEASQILNDDQVSLYTTHIGAVLDEMINLTDGKLLSPECAGQNDYNFAVSLLYHQLST